QRRDRQWDRRRRAAAHGAVRDAPARIEDRWGGGPAAGADELDQLVYLSTLIGREPRLVQPGGGNTSIKLGDALLVRAAAPICARSGGRGSHACRLQG